MSKHSRLPGLVLAAAAMLAVGSAAAADDGTVVRRGAIDDDLFVAGRSLDVSASVAGDLFAAGGWVSIDSRVTDNLIAGGGMMDIGGRTEGDLIAVGGVVDVLAAVGDNLVIAAGVVTVDGPVSGKLFASGGRLRVGRNADVAGDAWLAGGSMDVAGSIAGSTVIAGANVTLRGRFAGDVEVSALSLEVTRGAEIEGRLVHFGPDPPDIAEGATIAGAVEHRYEPKEPPPRAETGLAWPPLFWLAIVLALGLLFDLVLPQYVRSAGGHLVRHPFASLGLGLAILFVTPIVILLLIVSILGIAIGLAAIAAYGALLLLGPVIALFGTSDLVLRRFLPVMLRTDARRRLAFSVALVVLGLLGTLPYVGTTLLWLVTVIGLGAATWQLYAIVRAQSPARRGPVA